VSQAPDTLPHARVGAPPPANGAEAPNVGAGLLNAAVSTPPPPSADDSMSDPLAALVKSRRRRSSLSRRVNIRDIDTGEVTLSFTVLPVKDEQIEECNRAAMVYVGLDGKPMPEGRVDQFVYRLHMIYQGTAPEDRKRLWDNPAVLDSFGTLDPVEVIDETLLPGEKIGVFSVIGEISGFAFQNFSDAVAEAKKS
jgi:hypothetical protein